MATSQNGAAQFAPTKGRRESALTTIERLALVLCDAFELESSNRVQAAQLHRKSTELVNVSIALKKEALIGGLADFALNASQQAQFAEANEAYLWALGDRMLAANALLGEALRLLQRYSELRASMSSTLLGSSSNGQGQLGAFSGQMARLRDLSMQIAALFTAASDAIERELAEVSLRLKRAKELRRDPAPLDAKAS